MVTIELTTPVGRLTLRRVIEESYQFLQPLVAEHFTVREVLLNPGDSFSVPVYMYRDHKFTITLPLADFVEMDDAGFLLFLTREFVRQMPANVRRYCTDALDTYAVRLGLPTRAALAAMPASEGGAA
jgi:hypothetical protein